MRLLDLFCGAGGSAVGYHRAGFDEIVGVDIVPQKNYPFEFIQGDAMTFPLDGYDAIHASPPCQAYAKSRYLTSGHPMLVGEVRERLLMSNVPFVIENVPGAPLVNPVILTGADFGLRVRRTRLFECSFPMPFHLSVMQPPAVKMGRPVKDGDVIQPVGHFSGADYARQEMGINWMTKKELAQAIPPAYTEYIGRELRKVVGF